MRSDVRDRLRAHAERLADEALRLQRALTRAHPDAELARRHLSNACMAAERCWRDGLSVDAPSVIDTTEYAVAPRGEVRASKKERRRV